MIPGPTDGFWSHTPSPPISIQNLFHLFNLSLSVRSLDALTSVSRYFYVTTSKSATDGSSFLFSLFLFFFNLSPCLSAWLSNQAAHASLQRLRETRSDGSLPSSLHSPLSASRCSKACWRSIPRSVLGRALVLGPRLKSTRGLRTWTG